MATKNANNQTNEKESITEVEQLKLKLANLEIDYAELQSRLVELQHQLIAYQTADKKRKLAELSSELKEKYDLENPEQLNVSTGEITRNA